MELKEAASKSWKLVERITVPLSLGVMVWALLNLISLNDRTAKLEAASAADEAQWRILQTHTEQLKQQAIEVEVYKRMFEMLLDKDKLRVDRVSLPELPPSGRKTLEEFRTEQIQQSRK